MTHAEYHRYATLFDALLDVGQLDPYASATIRGAAAGAALRVWAAARRLDVEPNRLALVVPGGVRSWTLLEVSVDGWVAIAVHLDDTITVPIAEAA